MWQLDAYILDRIFQPIANLLHQWFGLTPAAIGEFFAAGNVVASMASYIADHPEFPYNFNSFEFVLSISGSCLLSFIIIFPRVSNINAVNTKRYTLFGIRTLELGFSIIQTSVLVLHLGSHLWSALTFDVSTIFLWLAACFVSLSTPPPRQVRQTRWVPA